MGKYSMGFSYFNTFFNEYYKYFTFIYCIN